MFSLDLVVQAKGRRVIKSTLNVLWVPMSDSEAILYR